jgi:hypothetical protein
MSARKRPAQYWPCLSCRRLVRRWLRGPGGVDRCPHCRYDQYVSAA